MCNRYRIFAAQCVIVLLKSKMAYFVYSVKRSICSHMESMINSRIFKSNKSKVFYK
jgi:hypothetical protein